jgi:N-acetylneuraminic acid mutarotase
MHDRSGSELVIWGRLPGQCETPTCVNSAGSRYNPDADRWNLMLGAVPPSLLNPRYATTPAVWTGKEMIVWSGHCNDIVCSGGGAYDPATDTWRAISELGAPAARDSYAAVWTGERVIVWGGMTYDFLHPQTAELTCVGDGAAYDPETNTWSPPLAAQGAPSPRIIPHRAWTGTRMLLWGGYFEAAPHFDLQALADGAAYDPATDTWQPMRAGGPAGGGVSVWTGSELIVWQGQSGAAYDPTSDSWRPLASENAPDPPANGPAVWTGTEMLIWGGAPAYGPGGRYNPKTNTWGAMTTAGQPSPRASAIAAWTGTDMIVWGGRTGDRPAIVLTDGARFTP